MAAADALCDRIGHHFADADLIETALRHRSWCAENGDVESNERLEFLGDSVLGLVVTDHIFSRYPSLPEGSMAKLRSDVVSSVSLAAVARDLQLGDALSLGKGEEASGGREKSSILADALEAVIGAVYVDGGWEPAAGIVMDRFAHRIERAARRPGLEDYKTRLQEHVARTGAQPPVYDVTGVGPDHEKQFFATVSIAGQVLGRGEGRTKKEAEQGAAGQAWEHLAADGAATGVADPEPTTMKATQ